MGEGKQRMCRCLCSCGEVHCLEFPGIASAKKGQLVFLFFGFFSEPTAWQSSTKWAVKVNIQPTSHTHAQVKESQRGGREDKPVNNKSLWSLFQYFTFQPQDKRSIKTLHKDDIKLFKFCMEIVKQIKGMTTNGRSLKNGVIPGPFLY